jgi:hypothetical protein
VPCAATSLKEQEKKLEAITDEQDTNVQSLVNLVKENRTTLAGLKVSLTLTQLPA